MNHAKMSHVFSQDSARQVCTKEEMKPFFKGKFDFCSKNIICEASLFERLAAWIAYKNMKEILYLYVFMYFTFYSILSVM